MHDCRRGFEANSIRPIRSRHQADHHHHPQSSARDITPAPAVTPRRNYAYQHQDQHDKKDRAQAHTLLLSPIAWACPEMKHVIRSVIIDSFADPSLSLSRALSLRRRRRGTLAIRGPDEPVRSCLELAELLPLAYPVYEEVEIPREHLAHDALAALPVVHAAAHVGPDASKATVEAGRDLLPSPRRRVGKPPREGSWRRPAS